MVLHQECRNGENERGRFPVQEFAPHTAGSCRCFSAHTPQRKILSTSMQRQFTPAPAFIPSPPTHNGLIFHLHIPLAPLATVNKTPPQLIPSAALIYGAEGGQNQLG